MNKCRTDNCIKADRGRFSVWRTAADREPSPVCAVLCAILIALAQCILFIPGAAEEVAAETAGENLTVRVQYFGERGDMIREKASFTRSELEGMGAQVWYYSNVTRVGTVMSMAAYGPEVMTIIEASGIDPASIKLITFRTTDGYTRNFTVDKHLSGGRYFYPALSSNYERSEDGTVLTPLEGSLEGAQEVPAILALTFGATKAPDVDATTLTQGTKDTYRFCMGQTPLVEGQQSRPGEDGGDVSSMDSVHSIYGMDVTLKGSPVSGIGIGAVSSNMKVGSITKLQIHVEGDELFAEDFGKALGKLTWSSSDPSIAKVDQEGNVTILKRGEVTITVKAANGMSASVVIHGTGKPKQQDRDEAKATKATTGSTQQTTTRPTQAATSGQQTNSTTAPAQEQPTVHLREISLGDKIEEPKEEEAVEERVLTEDTAALEEQKPYRKGTAAGVSITAALACGAGGFHRFRRFREILRGWKK